MMSLMWVVIYIIVSFMILMVLAVIFAESKSSVAAFFILVMVVSIGTLGHYAGTGTPAKISDLPVGQENLVIAITEHQESYLLTLEIGDNPEILIANKIPASLKAGDRIVRTKSGTIKITEPFIEGKG